MNTETIESPRIAAVLNRCIEACIDGQKYFALAAANVRNKSLKESFQRYSDERGQFVIALQTALAKAGITPENQGAFSGAMRRQLMEVIRALEPTHRDTRIVRECVNELEAALRVYANAMPLVDSLPVDLRVLVEEQQSSIHSALTATLGHFNSH
jgi:uncharacterized protein (TIGR02284 family)